MIYTYKELKNKYNTDYNIKKAIEKREVYKLEKGLYSDKEYVNIYDKERLLVELIRKRNQISFDYYKELISSYRESSDKLDMYKIEKYLALYKNEVNLSNVLLREVF